MQYRILSPLFQGTWVNEVRLQSGVQWELSDGDTLTFGSQSAPGSSEFYFLFQKVRVRPLDFEAITIPKVSLVYFYSLTRFKSLLFFFFYIIKAFSYCFQGGYIFLRPSKPHQNQSGSQNGLKFGPV